MPERVETVGAGRPGRAAFGEHGLRADHHLVVELRAEHGVLRSRQPHGVSPTSRPGRGSAAVGPYAAHGPAGFGGPWFG